MFIKNLSIIFILIFTSLQLLAQDNDYQAILTAITGEVTVEKSDSEKAKVALWGMQLFQGDKVNTGTESQVEILFKDQNLISLGANSSMTIKDNRRKKDKPAKSMQPVESDMVGELTLLAMNDGGNSEMGALAGLRDASDKQLEIISPRNCKVHSLTPEFAWQSDKKFEEYMVTLFEDAGPVWSVNTTTGMINYPNDKAPLTAGKKYFWYVTGKDLFAEEKSVRIGFQTLTTDEQKSVREREDKIKKLIENEYSNDTYDLMLSNMYFSEGLYSQAVAHIKNIEKRNPGSALPHQMLSRVYRQIGLKDLAIEELEVVVKLNR